MEFRQLERQSVQEFNPRDSTGYSFIWYEAPNGSAVPRWGEHARDRYLRELYRNQYNWIGQAAVAALTRKVKQVAWVIEGGKNNTAYFQRLLQDAHFKRGWGEFISRLLLDFTTCDYGAYVEIIGRGNPLMPITSRITGIATLDSLRCIPTGNLEYPVIYYSRISGKMHRMHNTRVHRWVDMPDNDETFHLAGLCSMSRSIALIEQQIPMSKYLAGVFSDMPPIGVWYNNSGMQDAQFKAAYDSFQLGRLNGKGGQLHINNPNLLQEAKGQFLPFAQAPEGFNYTEYTEIAVNAFAACFGIDRQDLWPLSGKNAGTATQSDVLMEKSYGMAFGDILSAIERILNNTVLPENVEFRFEYKDAEKDKATADADAIVLSNANALKAIGIPSENILKYLANNSEQFRDILIDESGELIELPDDDRVPTEQVSEEIDTEAEAINAANGDDNRADTPDASIQQDENTKAQKDIQATRLDFENRFNAIMGSMRDGDLNRRRAGTLLRSLIATTGARAYRDTLEANGVDSTELDAGDTAQIQAITALQSAYVSAFTANIIAGDGISDPMANNKAAQWWNGSITPFINAAALSATANAMYMWVINRLKENCDTCLRLDGQVHRLKSFFAKNFYPNSSALDCGDGKLCGCQFVKTTERARGRL